jgi:hypothetical protein
VSPVEATISSVTRAIGSFHPAAMPRLARLHYRRELLAWIFLPIMMGAVEGGVTSVLAKNAFAGAVPERWLNIAVAILSGAPAFANVTSFLWASLSHGRHKIRFLVGLQIAAVVLIAQVGLAPRNGIGLLMLLLAGVGARVCWSGVVTLRATVWHANYPRHVRARMAGKLTTVQAIMLAGVGLAIGLAMSSDERSYHVLYPLVAGCGLVGAMLYSRMRMRGHAAIVGSEQREVEERTKLMSPLQIWRVLQHDKPFRRYMTAMFIFGIGNLSIAAPLVIMLRDVFGYGYLAGILIMATIPIIMMPVSIPFWSRILDRRHIIRFRVIHSWAFVLTTLCVVIAALSREPAFLWVAAVMKGIAFGGGVLGWNLGHHDFASQEKSSQYMGVHVSLTGVRGLIGPPAAVGLYELLELWRPGGGAWVFVVCLAITIAGAIGFFLLSRSMGSELDR